MRWTARFRFDSVSFHYPSSSFMQACDSTCHWCARHFFAWLRDRMFSAQRPEGRSGAGSYADAAATSVKGTGPSSRA